MAEGIRDIADPCRASERRGDAQALLEIPKQRLARHEQVVGEHVPRPDEKTLRAYERLQARPIGGPHLEIVLGPDAVTVERERTERAVALEKIEELRHHRH